MAMLAEPRRKQKWSVDPRNSAWSKDESKFGQKMLEKMGWSKGKGLGAQEQGATEHIKVQLKNNTLGLGASRSYEDNWIAHQDDFNQLLVELNSHHGTGSAASSDSETKKSFSLEEKSKSSKKRVHYMKFAKGKDLSCRSDTDLACIFGKREKTKKSSKSSKEETDSEPEETGPDRTPSPTTETEPGNTVTSSLSVNEYFAKRMAALKKSYGRCTESVTENAEQEDSMEDYSEATKRKSKKNVEHEDHMEDYSEDTKRKSKKNLAHEDHMEDFSEDTKRKSKKNVAHEDHMEDYSENTKRKSKKRKHKKNEDNHCSEELEVEKDLQDENSVDSTEYQERRRKSKNKTEEKDLTVDNSEEQKEDETIRKKKKNKRKKELCEELQTEDVHSSPDEADQPKKKNKKQKKAK